MEQSGGDLLLITRDLFFLYFTKGLPVSIYLSLLGFVTAMLVGFIVGLIRFLRVPVLRNLLQVYVEGMRGLPFLMILYFLFYVMPFFDIRLTAFQTAVLALTMHTGAYISEIVRGSLLAIPKEQHESAQSLALSVRQRLQYVIIPQAVSLSLPPLAGQIVLHIKDTSLVSIIALTELTRIGRIQMQTNGQPLLTYAILAVFYFALCYPVLKLSISLEGRIAKKFR
ncbi:MAG: amino acid ABC transporter permease [Deltaproteobacteria bacterium]|nr:amino acid ABC transporter permease [Deltaproteobacteria bacterium]